jgi:CubicO group peptidase (beta-lactamase class C family)
MTTPIVGTVAPGWEAVRDAFAANWSYDGAEEVGAGVAIYHQGHKVVDLAGGWSDQARTQPYTDDTLQLVFSTTKGIVAIAVAMCVQRGLLEYNAPVSKYWPEFAANGKGDITVTQLISHQAGLLDVGEGATLANALEWSWMTDRLAAQAPEWEPGTKHGYHALTYGWLAGELVRRADPAHRSIGRFVAEEIVAPLDAEMWVGLPEAYEPRVSPIIAATPQSDPMMIAMMEQFMGPNSPGGRALFLRGAFSLASDELTFNRRDVHAAEIPAANGITNARSLARIYAATIGDVDGVRLVNDETRDVARTTVTPDNEPDYCLVFPTTFGMGFMTHGVFTPYAGPGSYGHSGAGGSTAFALPEKGLAFAYVMNQMASNLANDPRSANLIDAALKCIEC